MQKISYPARFSTIYHLSCGFCKDQTLMSLITHEILISLHRAIKRIKFFSSTMLGAIVTKGTFSEWILYKIFTSVTATSTQVIPPEPESSQTPPHYSSSVPHTATSSSSVTTFCQLKILTQGSQTQMSIGFRQVKWTKDLHEHTD